ncbi:MAG TPA: adenylate/guanylate cyclase domain-containing protein [Chthoniobacteraceae bacterium]
MEPLPSGTITFLFTDLEGSSVRWEHFPQSMKEALVRHDALLRETFTRHRGYTFKHTGDGFCVAFHTAHEAVTAAVEAQRALAAEPWNEAGPLKARMGLHTGAASLRDGDYFGQTLNRASRIMDAGHGGQILLSSATSQLARDLLPAGASLIHLGEYALRSMDRLEKLFQVVVPDLTSKFPALRTVEVLPNNLPYSATSFVGREQDMVEVQQLLGKTRMLTLTGPGGAGKTRLGLESGATVLPRYRDGVWLVELAPLRDADGVIETVANAIGLREQPDRSLTEVLHEALRKKQMLVILDNCEHLPEECRRVCSAVLQAAPGVTFLATSRQPLGVAGELVWLVPPLDVMRLPEGGIATDEYVHQLSQYEAVRLFIDRASAARPGFTLTRQNAAAVAEICYRLDGMPLAVELAAARVRVLSPEQIAAKLNDRFQLLRTTSRTVLPHQQTLHTLIDWSYDLLLEKEKLFFQRLGIFVGGRSLEALEAVCSGDGIEAYEVLDLLEQLVQKSLVTVEPGTDDESRYTMIESIWFYAREKLDESGESEKLAQRHFQYYLALAEEAAPHMEAPEQVAWLEKLHADVYNLREAIQWALTDHVSAEEGLRLVAALQRPWELRGSLDAAQEAYAKMLRKPGSEKPTLQRAKALDAAGRIAWCQDDYEIARRCYDEAVLLYRALGQENLAVFLETLIAFVDRGDGDLELAEAKLQRALVYSREQGMLRLEALSLSGLGTLALDRGDAPRGLEYKREGLALYRKLGDRWIIGLVLWGVARAATAQGDLVAARASLQEWLEILRGFRNRWALPYLLQALAELDMREQRAMHAATLLGTAEALRESLGLKFTAAEAADYTRLISRLKEQLSESDFEDAWAEGRNLSPSQALEDAPDTGIKTPT